MKHEIIVQKLPAKLASITLLKTFFRILLCGYRITLSMSPSFTRGTLDNHFPVLIAEIAKIALSQTLTWPAHGKVVKPG